MSSTKLGNDRHVSDYYITPVGEVVKFFGEFTKLEPHAFDGVILDPCAGGDEFNQMSYPTAINRFFGCEKDIQTVDIRNDSLAHTKGDYLNMELDYKPDIIITNPPFFLAEDIIRKSLKDVSDNGFVVMLLRLNFYGSVKRKPLFENFMPKYSFVHHKRMSFTGGATDSIEYQHCVWQKGVDISFTELRVI